MFAALYVKYCRIAGFSSYFVAHWYNVAQQPVESEAQGLEEIHRLAAGFPDARRLEIQGLAESYARTVVEEGFTYLLGVATERLHVFMVFYAAVLAFVLYTIRALDHPFDGLAQIEGEPAIAAFHVP